MANKTALFHGCARSEIKVTPENWEKEKAQTCIPWKIYYRFYDPATKGTKDWGKQIVLPGVNEYKKVADRQRVTRALIEHEKELLDNRGYNPITGQFMLGENKVFEISPDLDFITALREALKKVSIADSTRTHIGYVIDGVEIAAKMLHDIDLGVRYNLIPISKIRIKHIKYILEQCAKNSKKFTNNTHNSYKNHLSIVFNELKQIEAIETNPTKDISTKKKFRKLRAILSPEDLQKIETLRERCYHFWRYMRIFFRSGSRTTELFSLKKEGVNIKSQEFVIVVKKDDEYREDWRPIGNDVLHLWKEVYDQAKPGEYLFSRKLQPGIHKMHKSQTCRYWNRYVTPDVDKGGLGIKKRFYDLKSTHSDIISDKLSLQHAQAIDGHTNENTTKIYAIGEDRRRKERVKNTDIKFA